ncbi:MAG TPA: hypothetical protein VNT28_00185 [Candidatus Limnocylindrales bacterium]|nr:hypothetical protein [Candidatus Limnocylindrales bacterium]
MEKNEQRAAPQAPGAPGAGTGTPPEAVPRSAEDGRSGISGMATTIAGAAGPVLSAALRPVGELTSGARRAIGERSGARVRRVRQRGRQPLLNMWEVHPEAHRAALRELGMLTVPADEIAGTAVEGPTQRGGDFLPLRQLRGADWRARWARILEGIDRMAALPPVDLLKFGDRYWVVDGHNRVAAALYTGQVAIDANVVELRLPGMPSAASGGNLAPYLEGSRDLREAGSGRLTRTTVRPASGLPEHPLDEHPEHSPGHDHAQEEG